jgi:hypothetical protein
LYKNQPYSYPDNNPKRHFIRYEYSESPSGTHYHLRQICLDNGKVAEITSYFYID